jgi:hypothetical protein
MSTYQNCGDHTALIIKYESLLRRYEALARASERQSESLALALKEKNDTLVKLASLGEKRQVRSTPPPPKYEVGQTVLVKQVDGHLRVCTIRDLCFLPEYHAWRYTSKNNGPWVYGFSEDRIRPLTEEQLR